MTINEAKKMVEAKLECMERDVSGIYDECNNHRCGECYLNYAKGNMGEQKEWLRMSIKALEQQPCEDAISRQAVLNKILKFSVTDGKSVSVTGLWTEVNHLHSVTPHPKIGRWIRKTVAGCFVYGCNQCGWQQTYATDFCPDCGARMVESQESEDE